MVGAEIAIGISFRHRGGRVAPDSAWWEWNPPGDGSSEGRGPMVGPGSGGNA